MFRYFQIKKSENSKIERKQWKVVSDRAAVQSLAIQDNLCMNNYEIGSDSKRLKDPPK